VVDVAFCFMPGARHFYKNWLLIISILDGSDVLAAKVFHFSLPVGRIQIVLSFKVEAARRISLQHEGLLFQVMLPPAFFPKLSKQLRPCLLAP
jgi:hypothetical protein